MVTEQITITEKHGMDRVSGEVYVSERSTTGEEGLVEVPVTSRWMKDYLTAEDDPVLARVWDNDDDAIYDDV